MCCPASCTMSVFDGDMAFQRWRSVSNAMKTYYVTQIGRNTLKTTNRQLFDMSIELPNVTKERCSKREWCAPVLHGCKAQRNIYVNFVEFFFFYFYPLLFADSFSSMYRTHGTPQLIRYLAERDKEYTYTRPEKKARNNLIRFSFDWQYVWCSNDIWKNTSFVNDFFHPVSLSHSMINASNFIVIALLYSHTYSVNLLLILDSLQAVFTWRLSPLSRETYHANTPWL